RPARCKAARCAAGGDLAMSARVFIARDAGALAVGADEVAAAVASAASRRGLAVDVTRTGSRGLYWLAPPPWGAPPPAPPGLWPGGTRGCRCVARRGPSAGRATSIAAWLDRRDSLAQAPDQIDVRALRRHRPAVARGLPRARRLRGARARAVAWSASDHRRSG